MNQKLIELKEILKSITVVGDSNMLLINKRSRKSIRT